MITCPNCGRENADNFNFCLDCGTELSAATNPATPAPAPVPTSPAASFEPARAMTADAAAPAPAPVAEQRPTQPSPAAPAVIAPKATQAAAKAIVGAEMGTMACPKCGASNLNNMKFCGECGQRLGTEAPAMAGGAGKTMFLHAADVSALAKPKARLITIDQAGREGMTFNLSTSETVCGRSNGTILFFDDPFVSPTHCTFLFEDGVLAVLDHNSLNGVFARVRTETVLEDGDLLRMGRQLFKLETSGNGAKLLFANQGDDARPWGSPAPEAWARLVQILDDGTAGGVHLLSGDECRIGREVGDILLPNDGFISASHCALSLSANSVVMRDLGSSNGTYVRIRSQRELVNDDFILIGNQMLRVELR